MAELKEVPTRGDDALFRRFQRGDEQTLYDLQTLAIGMTVEELQRFCEGSMNALVVVQDQFRKRFPTEYAAWEAQFNDGAKD
jgi:hypothetical protein